MSQQTDIEELAKVALLNGLKPHHLAKVNSVIVCQTFPAETNILRIHQPGNAVYIIKRGSVKITLDRPNEPSVILGILGAGEVLGEISVVDGLGHSADVITLEDCELYWLQSDVFLECLVNMPTMAFNLASVLTRRMRLATAQIQSLATQDVYGRTARQLLAFANAYGYENEEGQTVIPVRLTQHSLAGLIGASRVRVNQVLTAFKREGFISVGPHHYFIIHDRAALASYCS